MEILLRSARRASPFPLASLTSLSYWISSSSKGSFSSWNFFLIFSFTSSGFSRINLMSIIFPPTKIKTPSKGTMLIAVPPYLLNCFTWNNQPLHLMHNGHYRKVLISLEGGFHYIFYYLSSTDSFLEKELQLLVPVIVFGFI